LLNTLADYSGNLKTAETTKTLKYGDIKVKNNNKECYFINANSGTIKDINLIKMIDTNSKSLSIAIKWVYLNSNNIKINFTIDHKMLKI